METKSVKVSGYRVSIPPYFEPMRKVPRELKGLNPHVAQTENASCALLFEYDKSLSDVAIEKESLVRSMHDDALADNEGLVAVEVGEMDGKPYVYSILKTLMENNGVPTGVEYALTALLAWKKGVVRIRGYFDEQGTTSMRDSIVFAMRSKEMGDFEATRKGWAKDPYDPSRTVGTLINVSEREELDAMFPAHPLSIAHEVVRCILGQRDGAESEAADDSEGQPEGKGATPHGDTTRKLFGRVAEVAGGVEERAVKAVNTVADTAGGAASAVAKAAGDTADAIGEKVKGIKVAKDKPNEYDKAVIAYNMAYTNLSDAGLDLYRKRERSVDLMGHMENLVNSIANRPKSFDGNLGEISTHKREFRDAEEFARQEITAARQSATSAGAGVAAGMAVASMAPSAAMWIATTFGTASTGTAISTLSGAAATQAALAWLGGGALAAGGGGTAAGSALLALAGPIGWGIAGATLLTSIVLFAKKKHTIRGKRQKELTAVKENTERVSKMSAIVGSLAIETDKLHTKLSDLYYQCVRLFGSDFSTLSPDDQDRLSAMVNSTLTLSRLLGKRVSQEDEGLSGETSEE